MPSRSLLVSEVAKRRAVRVGWFSTGFVSGAVLMFLALVKVLSDNGWSLWSQWDHEPKKATAGRGRSEASGMMAGWRGVR